jgi:hypothetical protein
VTFPTCTVGGWAVKEVIVGSLEGVTDRETVFEADCAGRDESVTVTWTV